MPWNSKPTDLIQDPFDVKLKHQLWRMTGQGFDQRKDILPNKQKMINDVNFEVKTYSIDLS